MCKTHKITIVVFLAAYDNTVDLTDLNNAILRFLVAFYLFLGLVTDKRKFSCTQIMWPKMADSEDSGGENNGYISNCHGPRVVVITKTDTGFGFNVRGQIS